MENKQRPVFGDPHWIKKANEKKEFQCFMDDMDGVCDECPRAKECPIRRTP